MKKIGLIIAVIAVILVALGVVYSMWPVTVQSTVVKRGIISKIVPQDGLVRTKEDANISSEVSGKIEKLLVEEGKPVNAGDIIAEVEKTQLSSRVTQAETELSANEKLIKDLKSIYEKTKTDFERMQSLEKEGAVSQDKLEASEISYKSARKNYETAQLANDGLNALLKSAKDLLDKATIKSPINGVITIVYKKQGETVVPGTPLVRIVNPKSAYIEIEIADSDIGDVKIGQSVRITADGCPGAEFKGVLDQIIAEAELKGERIDVSTIGEERIFRGIVKMQEYPECLRPGMSLYADIIIEPKENVLVIPREAVLSESGKFYVYVVKDGYAQKRNVEVGIKESEKVEITEGLKDGETVAITELEKLKDGKRVNVHPVTP
ncbi:MAG: efflux RND transporter periplasmic adaptor subunit [Planctomycetes bacterium]|nr:efflux RND transporter periplasmic adaptor subunit [Planctomycetota bacterium]